MGKFQTSNTDLDYRFQTYFSIYRIVLVFAVDPETNMNLFSFGSRLCCKYPVGMCVYIYIFADPGWCKGQRVRDYRFLFVQQWQ